MKTSHFLKNSLIIAYKNMGVTEHGYDNKTVSIKLKIDIFNRNTIFFPTALKGCQGIVFTHGVWLGGGKKFVRAVSQKP